MVPLFQAIHNSESNKSKAQKINSFKEKGKIDKPTAVVYGFTSRSTPLATECAGGAEPFVRVINENTKEFNDLSLALHARRIDFVQIARHLLNEAAEDKNRGNVQQNLLFSAGENHTRINSRNYGCALPAVNKGTEDWVELAVEMSVLARKLNIPWVDPLTLTEKDKKRNTLFCESVHKDNVFEGITLALLELFPCPGKVKEHTDQFNCAKRTHTILFSEIVCIDHKIYRVCVIAYMRKSCHDAMIRMEACEEVVENTNKYVSTLPGTQKPVSTVDCYKSYYESLGGQGLALIVDKGSKKDHIPKIHSVALLSPPHIDKPMSYLSPITNAIRDIYERNSNLTYQDLFLMCLPVGQLNSTFTYGTVLSQLQTLPHVQNDGPLGVLSTIIDSIKDLCGSYSSGSFIRSQVSWQYKVMKAERFYQDIEVLMKLCFESRETPPGDMEYETFCDQKCLEFVKVIKGRILGVGEFGAQHIITVLAQLNLLHPIGVVHCAQLATSTSTLKTGPDRPSPLANPKLRGYISGSFSKSGSGNAQKSDRARRVVAAVVPYMRQQGSIPWMTSTYLDQVNCESYRSKTVFDVCFPGSKHIHMPPLPGVEKPKNDSSTSTKLHGVSVMVPFTKGGTLQVATKQVRNAPTPRQRSTVDGTSNREGTVSLDGPKPGKEYIRIPHECIASHPGLLQSIQKVFCSNKMDKTIEWVESHEILMQLVKHFSTNRSPMNATAHTKRFFAKKRPFDCVIHEQNQEAVPKTRRKARVKLTTAHANLPMNGAKEAVELRETTFFPQQNNVKECDMETEEEEKKESNMLTPSTGPERNNPTPLEQVRLVYTAEGFGIYRFETYSQFANRATKSFPKFKTYRRLTSQCRYELQLSPLLGEVKRALFFGLQESAFTAPLTKATLVAKTCTNETYVLERNRTAKGCGVFVTSWLYHESIPVTTAGVCVLVDKLATLLGGSKVEVRNIPGLFHWAFPTCQLSKRHYIQSLMLLDGKVEYFRNLRYRIYMQLKTDKAVPGSLVCIGLTTLSKLLESKRKTTVFYAVVKLDDTGLIEDWGLVPSLGAMEQQGEVLDCPSAVLDAWTWKDEGTVDNKLLTIPMPCTNTPDNTEAKRAPRRKSRQRSRTAKKIWHKAEQSLEMNMEIACFDASNEVSTVTNETFPALNDPRSDVRDESDQEYEPLECIWQQDYQPAPFFEFQKEEPGQPGSSTERNDGKPDNQDDGKPDNQAVSV